MVRNQVAPQLRLSGGPARILPSGVFQLSGDIRLVPNDRHGESCLAAVQGSQTTRVLPNTKIALDPIYPSPRQQFRISGYSGGLSAFKQPLGSKDAIKSASTLDYLQVHVSNKSPYMVQLECSIGGILKKESFAMKQEANFNGVVRNWTTEALTLLASVVDTAFEHFGTNPSAEGPEANQQDQHRDETEIEESLQKELGALKSNIDGNGTR